MQTKDIEISCVIFGLVMVVLLVSSLFGVVSVTVETAPVNEGLQGEKKVALDSSKQITVNLMQPPFYTTPFGLAALAIVIFIVGVAIVAIVSRRKKKMG